MAFQAFFSSSSSTRTTGATSTARVTAEQRLAAMRTTRETLRRRVDELRVGIERLVAQARADGEMAARTGNAKAKERALATLATKQPLERELRAKLTAMRRIDEQLAVVDEAHVNASLVATMRDGAALMADVNSDLDVATINRDMVDARMQAARVSQVSALVAQPLFVFDADADGTSFADEERVEELDAELAALLATKAVLDDDAAYADAPVASLSSSSSSTSIVASSPSLVPATRAKPLKELEDEFGL
jgi:hypothetical protein